MSGRKHEGAAGFEETKGGKTHLVSLTINASHSVTSHLA